MQEKGSSSLDSQSDATPVSTPRARITWVVPFAAFSLVVAYPWSSLPMRWSVNDDLGIIAFLRSGHDPVFLSVLLGRVLRVTSEFIGVSVSEVYPWSLQIFQGACAAVAASLLARLVGAGRRSVAFWLIAATYGAVLAMFCIQLTFTMVAGLLGAHAFWLLANSATWRGALLAGTMAAVGCLIRLDAVKLVGLLLAAPALFWVLSGRRGTALLVAALPVVSALAVEWALAERFNGLRGRIHGTPLVGANRDNDLLLQAAGWTITDYLMFEHWVFFDEQKFNEQSLSQYLVHAKTSRSAPEPRSGLEHTLRSLGRRWELAGASLALVVLALGARRRAWLVVHAVTLALVTMYLDTFMRLPTRVYEVMLVAAWIGAIQLWVHTGRDQRLAFVLACCFLLVRTPLVAQEAGFTSSAQRQVHARLEALHAAHPGAPVLLWHTDTPPIQMLHPFHAGPRGAELIFYGWAIFSPYFYDEIARVLGVRTGREVLPALLAREDTVYVAPAPAIGLLIGHLRERYDLHASARRLRGVDEYEYWKLVRFEPHRQAR
jgi:hypothetical protein